MPSRARRLTISAPASNVPIEEPSEDRINTSRTLNILFLYQPENLPASFWRFSISRTLGLHISACTIPVKMPTPIKGHKEVKGAPTKATRIVSGFASARRLPKAASVPFHKIQEPII